MLDVEKYNMNINVALGKDEIKSLSTNLDIVLKEYNPVISSIKVNDELQTLNVIIGFEPKESKLEINSLLSINDIATKLKVHINDKYDSIIIGLLAQEYIKSKLSADKKQEIFKLLDNN